MSDATSFDEFQPDDHADFLLWTLERAVTDYREFTARRAHIIDHERIRNAVDSLQEILHDVG